MAFIRPALVQDASLLLRTGSVVLRPPQMSDFDAWSSLRDVSRAHLVPYEPQWTIDELARAAFRERVKRYQRDQKDDQGYAFFIFADTGRGLVGGITLSNVRRGVAQAASIGYWVGLPHTRRGYVGNALVATKRFAFEELRLHRLEAACMPGNGPSIAAIESAGFAHEGLARRYLKINGVWEDHLLYALTLEDWLRGSPA